MRLTCPSCKAVYEAPDEDIGVGRRVECSACGAQWYQPGETGETAGGGGSRMPGMAEAAAEIRALREEEPAGETPEPQITAAAPVAAGAAAGAAAPGPARPEEAQTPGAASARTQTMSGDETPAIPPAAQAAAARRPANVDARRLTAELRAADDEPERGGGAGFAVGLVLALLIGAAAAGAYLERDRLAAMAPQAAPALERYAETVDDARRAVEGAADSVAERLDPLVRQLRQTLRGGEG
ncbi:MAG: zinc-ribbon domain-containing protein [Pseudomonadota bacterium]